MTPDSSITQLMKPKVEASLFILCGLIFCVLLTGAKHTSHFWWFNYLITCRIILIAFAFTGAYLSFRNRMRNILSSYFVVCALLQSSFSTLEGPDQIQFYEYITYFLLLGSLAYHGTFSDWLKRYYPLFLLAEVFPLFFKNSKYFATIGDFAFNLTTTVAISFVALMIIRVTSTRFAALVENLSLKSKLLAREEKEREIVERELEAAKIKIIQISKTQATIEIAQQVAHDIRSPLSALNIVTGLIDGISDEKRHLMMSSVRRINEIANDLLAMSKKAIAEERADDTLPDDELIPVDDVVAEVVAEKLIQVADHPNLVLKSINNQTSHVQVRANKKEIARLLSNLIENGIESLPKKSGQIIVETHSQNQTLHLYVSDTGCGIPEAVVSRIGEQGFSYGKTSNGSGNGLGVYHARKMIERYGGKFFLKSKLGKGTKVSIELPIAFNKFVSN